MLNDALLVRISAESRSVVALIAERIWGDPAIAEMVTTRRKGWLNHLASRAGVERLTLKRVISDLGESEFDALVAANPAGDAPIVVQSDTAMASTYGSCLHGTGTCGSCLHQTGTCGTCATCYAQDGSFMN